MTFPCITSIQLNRHLEAEQAQEEYNDACHEIIEEMLEWSAREAIETLMWDLDRARCERLQDLLNAYAMKELARREVIRKRDEDGQ